jgi:hypothetical protein
MHRSVPIPNLDPAPCFIPKGLDNLLALLRNVYGAPIVQTSIAIAIALRSQTAMWPVGNPFLPDIPFSKKSTNAEFCFEDKFVALLQSC